MSEARSISLAHESQSWSRILGETIKTGIIRSNLVVMFAGLSVALYTNQISPLEKIPEIILAILGSSLVIGAAGTLNNVYDRDIDSIMDRVKNRPTVTGAITLAQALWLGGGMSVLGLVLLWLASPLAALFGFLGLFAYAVAYTMWSKRHTIYNTEIGSLSGAMPPLIGWAAITSDFNMGALGLFVVMLLWQMPHFYAIAIRRHDEYKAAGIPMLPVVKGFRRTYLQTNFYLVALIASSFLFMSLSVWVVAIALVLSIAWLVISIVGSKRMQPEKWATTLFIFSLNHVTVLFTVIILYSIIGSFL
ncbi:heme o synthase [Paenibacillus sp. GCM10012307]|uniref:Protoheme IX farnesyltransferase n=1 Tax=Paenibacillus roseus TaxID=2798579 RepID=A0A934J3Y3_9BACL|nr:heme o synthase [Paenibacillus roseus]MBJ6364306.1 protoheme IX farnesyltransferase [Paenibacillus roseus]